MDLDLISSLRIASYNCNSVRKRIDIVRSILNKCDILLLQEILLLEEDKNFLYGLNSLFEAYVVPSKHSNSNCLEGRPSGGLAILWRKQLNISIDISFAHDNFLIVSLVTMNKCFALANIYMPYDNGSREILTEYDQVLGELHASLNIVDTDNIIWFGDFNADHNRGRLWPRLSDFSSENGFRFVDSTLPYDSFSFISSAHSTTSWIDHCLISGNIDVANYEINYELAFYDHLPLFLTIKTIISYDANDDANDDLLYKLVDWNHLM